MSVREAGAGCTTLHAQWNTAYRRQAHCTLLVTFLLGSAVWKSIYWQRPLAFTGKPLEIGQHRRDQLQSSRVLIGQRRGKQIEQVARLLGGIVPIRRGRREQLRFQFILPQPQRPLVGFHFRHHPAQAGGLLGRHAATLIEIDGLVGHEWTTRRANGYSALSYNCRMPPLSNLSSPTSRKAPIRSSGSRSSMAKRMASAAWAKRR